MCNTASWALSSLSWATLSLERVPYLDKGCQVSGPLISYHYKGKFRNQGNLRIFAPSHLRTFVACSSFGERLCLSLYEQCIHLVEFPVEPTSFIIYSAFGVGNGISIGKCHTICNGICNVPLAFILLYWRIGVGVPFMSKWDGVKMADWFIGWLVTCLLSSCTIYPMTLHNFQEHRQDFLTFSDNSVGQTPLFSPHL